jgi:hypothetical protein
VGCFLPRRHEGTKKEKFLTTECAEFFYSRLAPIQGMMMKKLRVFVTSWLFLLRHCEEAKPTKKSRTKTGLPRALQALAKKQIAGFAITENPQSVIRNQ